jgi:transcriptional regulator with XRE-family HTH domain
VLTTLGIHSTLLTVPAHPTSPAYPARAQAFSDQLKRLRDARGLTQEKLAERAGISRSRLQLLEWNRKDTRSKDGPANPTLDVVWQLADALEVSLAELVDPKRD